MTNVPSKFVDAQGNVNVQALAQSYQQLGGNPYDYADQQGNVDVENLAVAYSEAERINSRIKPGQITPQIETTQPDAAAMNWDNVRLDAQGRIPPAVRQQLVSAGIATRVIDQHEAGLQAIQENSLLRVAGALPGGMPTYQAMIEWVNTALPLEERRSIASALAGAGGEHAALGIYGRYVAANPTGDADAVGDDEINTLGGGGNMAGDASQQPFMSAKDRHAAFSDKRYGTDVEYTQQVWARARVTAAAVANAQKTDPSKNWRGS
jgi:hypothetical protein